MYKVLIADDEKRICKLIKCLVDWEAKEMEVISVVHNGLEALEIVKADKPDIIITDIRMPELDGLDLIRELKAAHPDIAFIIISGYRQFEYARKALQYGAEDYLLKPIKENELNRVLDRILQQKTELKKATDEQKQLKETSLEHIKKMHEIFVNDMVMGYIDTADFNMEYLQNEYCCEFPFSCYVLIGIKLDFDIENLNPSEIAEILKKRIQAIVDNNLGELESTVYYSTVTDNILYGLLNFEKEQEKKLRHKIRHIISDIRNMGGNENLSVHTTVGISSLSDDCSEINCKVSEVKDAIMDRLIKGVDKIIEYQKKSVLFDVNDYINFPMQKKILDCVESRNRSEILKILEVLKERLKVDEVNDGQFLLMIWNGVIEVLLLGCKNCFHPETIEKMKEVFSSALHTCYSQEQMETKITRIVDRLLIKMDSALEEKGKKPIQDAKRYIQLHYMEPLTLEMVGDYAGLNPAYFSSLFKQEEGVSFLEFLTIVRMKKAKELLMTREKTMRDIAADVGYQDEKYFSRAFKKTVGLSPSEYRKIYC